MHATLPTSKKTPSPLLALLDRLTELRPRQLCDAPPDEPRLWTRNEVIGGRPFTIAQYRIMTTMG